MIDTTGFTDTIEMKIENEMQDLKDGMKDFKGIVFAALHALKNQVVKSMTVSRVCPNRDNTEVLQSAETRTR